MKCRSATVLRHSGVARHATATRTAERAARRVKTGGGSAENQYVCGVRAAGTESFSTAAARSRQQRKVTQPLPSRSTAMRAMSRQKGVERLRAWRSTFEFVSACYAFIFFVYMPSCFTAIPSYFFLKIEKRRDDRFHAQESTIPGYCFFPCLSSSDIARAGSRAPRVHAAAVLEEPGAPQERLRIIIFLPESLPCFYLITRAPRLISSARVSTGARIRRCRRYFSLSADAIRARRSPRRRLSAGAEVMSGVEILCLRAAERCLRARRRWIAPGCRPAAHREFFA